MEIIERLNRQVIISVQAMKNEPFYEETAIIAMMKSVVEGGASGLRLAGARDIINAKKLFNIPIIGITKPDILPDNWKEIVYITPTLDDVKTVIQAGADIVAVDATLRNRPKERLEGILRYIKSQKKLAMADVSNYKEGENADKLGFDIVSTTLSGYTTYTDNQDIEPDFALLEKLAKNLDCPVFLEGRIEQPEQVTKAFELGAHSVVIGSAVTRPKLITKRFVDRK